MKFKCKPEKANFVLMTFIVVICLVTCIFWLLLKKYVYFACYLILTLIIIHTYYFQYYVIKNKHLEIHMGFLNIKFKCKEIKKVTKLDNKVKIELNKINFTIYPLNTDLFMSALNKEKAVKK